ncbi:hypothetical protein FOZ63_018881, partial [Perkinsus olseni]
RSRSRSSSGSRSRSGSGSPTKSKSRPAEDKEGALRRFFPPFRCGRCGVGRKEQRQLDEEVRSRYQLKVGEIDPQLIVKKELSDDELVDYGIQLAQLASVAKSNGKK